VPSRIDFSRCGQGYFESWTGRGWATDRWQQGPGQVDRLWILNVNGKRLVIDANYLPSATRRQRKELDRVVHSIRFLSVPPRKTASAASDGGAGDRNGDWIAYSTAPAGRAAGRVPPRSGSDVFMTRRGDRRPVLVAGRGGAKAWNVCPVFSPNGRMLAFARLMRARSSIVVVHIGGVRSMVDGFVDAAWRVLKVSGGHIRCPRWSSDSSRLAYVDSGRVVVRGLDGSRPRWASGDPTIHDFDRNTRVLLSPTGDLIARSGPNATIVVSRPDGSDQHVVKDPAGYSSYAIAGWSPDGRKLLVMEDVGGGFRMRAASVRWPWVGARFATVVAYARVNNARSWPGYGDVSWQPIPKR